MDASRQEDLFRWIQEHADGAAAPQAEALREIAGMAVLAAGAVQDIGGPLGYLVANLEFLDGELTRHEADLLPGRSTELRQCLREAILGAGRIRDIVRDVQESRQGARRETGVDLHRVLLSCIKVARTEIDHRARVITEFDAVPIVSGSESRLSRLFLNLIVNAAQAVAGDAENEHFIRVSTRNEADHRIRVDVADSGPGIPREHIDYVFDPFFTTKPAGQGTGLGLSICREIVNGLGGAITVSSNVGRGATFQVILPTSRQSREGPVRSSETRFAASSPPVRKLPLRQLG